MRNSPSTNDMFSQRRVSSIEGTVMQVVLSTGEKLYQDAKKGSDGSLVAGDWQRYMLHV